MLTAQGALSSSHLYIRNMVLDTSSAQSHHTQTIEQTCSRKRLQSPGSALTTSSFSKENDKQNACTIRGMTGSRHITFTDRAPPPPPPFPILIAFSTSHISITASLYSSISTPLSRNLPVSRKLQPGSQSHVRNRDSKQNHITISII